jgi:phosphoglycolate phosphatase-like HAD superfamily hydrolase
MKELQAIIFDFDGVLVESVDVKGDAFVALYKDETPEIREKVKRYHSEHGGISRFEKIRYYDEVLCGREISEAQVLAKAARFGEIVEDIVVATPYVDGAEVFLKTYAGRVPFFVVSATPQDELERIISRRGMKHYFEVVLGSPIKKPEHTNRILRDYRLDASRICFIGDAMTDYEAAQICGTNFIGRKLPGKLAPFPKDVMVLADLTGLARALGLA